MTTNVQTMKLAVIAVLAIAAQGAELRGRSRANLGEQLLCPMGSGTLSMRAGDWCVMNCSTSLSYNIDFGVGQYAQNLGNVEILDEDNFRDFLDGYPFFHYQAQSQIGVNVAKAKDVLINGPLVVIQCANQAHGAAPAAMCGQVKFTELKCTPACGGAPCDPSAATCCRDNRCYPQCVGGTCCEVAQTGAVVGCCTQGGDCCGSIQVPTCCGPGAQCCHAGAATNACCLANSYCCTTSPTGCCLRDDAAASDGSFPDPVSGTPRLLPKTPPFMRVSLD